MNRLIRFCSILLILFLSIVTQADSQNPVEVSTVVEMYNGKNYYLHTVEAKQTIYAIAKAYQITPESVLNANPAARRGIRVNQVLRLPVGSNTVDELTNINKVENQPAILKDYDFIYHVADENDKFSYIAEIYMVSENNIRLANPSLTEPLNQGVYVRVPISSKDKKPLVAEDQFKRNDYDPFIPPTRSKEQQGSSRMDVVSSSKPEDVQMVTPFEVSNVKPETEISNNSPEVEIDNNITRHVVKPKETVYSISKLYNLNAESLRNANPGLTDALKIGQVLVIPTETEMKTAVNGKPQSQVEKPKTTFELPQAHVDESKIEEPVVQKPETDSIIRYTVKKGETLYSISRSSAVSIADLKKKNKGLTEQIRVGQVILIPKKKINASFVIHEVTKEQKTNQLAHDFDISTERLQKSNPNLGRKVYIGQKVKIPIDDNLRISPLEPGKNNDETAGNKIDSQKETTQKSAETEHKIIDPKRLFKVALMLPLYLEEVDSVSSFSNTTPEIFMASKPFSFIQFYEGFLIAVDSLVKTKGLKLELHVFDVDQNLSKLNKALADPVVLNCDLIIGPFFGNAFEKAAGFALEHKIAIVNPMSPRSEIIANNPFVIKVRPGEQFQNEQVVKMIAALYPQAKVFIYRSQLNKFKDESQQLRSLLEATLPKTVAISNAGILEVVKNRSLSGQSETEQYIPTLTNEGKKLFTNQIQQSLTDSTVFENPVTELVFQTSNIDGFSKRASIIRPNIVITFANDNVFAMDFVNKLNQEADTFQIRMICLPNWEKYDNLFVDNLIRMKATYLMPSNINYTDNQTIQFIQQFKKRFSFEPEQYAFSGFDIGYYFLEALMLFGNELPLRLIDFEKDMLQSQYYFTRSNEIDGIENRYWNFVKHSDYQLLPETNYYFLDKN
ncbi:MAG: LysM peptidoglycan-binding domain-containing protein [Bacteroidales bacterium]|nr:LysM peptidoglycan-binding domain-containing protein [Bacteroidales bacterium]